MITTGLRNKMFNSEILLLVTCVTLSSAVRVDFGTKGGPIVPAAPATTKRPQQPYRKPAPVWEAQPNDIPNPNKYQYVLPPPSRPKPKEKNYKQSGQHKPREFVFGKVISPDFINSLFHPTTVASLSPQYIPNFGFKYHAVVPSSQKTYYTKNTDAYYNDKLNKFNGKYNAKTKKYKVYEKVKYSPEVYYSNFIQLPAPSFQQQLPLLQAPQPFRMPELIHPSQASFQVSTPKISYTKDDLNTISKNYKTQSTFSQNSLSFESNKVRR